MKPDGVNDGFVMLLPVVMAMVPVPEVLVPMVVVLVVQRSASAIPKVSVLGKVRRSALRAVVALLVWVNALVVAAAVPLVRSLRWNRLVVLAWFLRSSELDRVTMLALLDSVMLVPLVYMLN